MPSERITVAPESGLWRPSLWRSIQAGQIIADRVRAQLQEHIPYLGHAAIRVESSTAVIQVWGGSGAPRWVNSYRRKSNL